MSSCWLLFRIQSVLWLHINWLSKLSFWFVKLDQAKFWVCHTWNVSYNRTCSISIICSMYDWKENQVCYANPENSAQFFNIEKAAVLCRDEKRALPNSALSLLRGLFKMQCSSNYQGLATKSWCRCYGNRQALTTNQSFSYLHTHVSGLCILVLNGVSCFVWHMCVHYHLQDGSLSLVYCFRNLKFPIRR